MLSGGVCAARLGSHCIRRALRLDHPLVQLRLLRGHVALQRIHLRLQSARLLMELALDVGREQPSLRPPGRRRPRRRPSPRRLTRRRRHGHLKLLLEARRHRRLQAARYLRLESRAQRGELGGNLVLERRAHLLHRRLDRAVDGRGRRARRWCSCTRARATARPASTRSVAHRRRGRRLRGRGAEARQRTR